MAQAKRKRKTKHRGNAAGMVESRGRTGRRPTEAEKSGKGSRSSGGSGGAKSGPRPHRLDRPPTWKSSLFRAVAAAGTFFGFLVLFFDRPTGPSAVISIAMIAFYTPLGYFTDLWIHRRRVAKQAREKAK